MRKVSAHEIREKVKRLCMETNYYLPEDVIDALREAYGEEESPEGKSILSMILKNIEIARKQKVPLCQDTGVAVFFIEMGQEVQIVEGDFEDAINKGVKDGYTQGYLRKSMVTDPLFARSNTQDNTPCIIHLRIVPGEKINIVFVPKGAGAENMSKVCMLTPADGVKGVREFVLQTVKDAGSNACPPLVVGVGVGGDFEMAPLLAKKSLQRDIGTHNPHPEYSRLEKELLVDINKLGIGPQGLGGRITALAVNIEWLPCHIASLPTAVNLQCHAARHQKLEL